jgi:hypothetical protein
VDADGEKRIGNITYSTSTQDLSQIIRAGGFPQEVYFWRLEFVGSVETATKTTGFRAPSLVGCPFLVQVQWQQQRFWICVYIQQSIDAVVRPSSSENLEWRAPFSRVPG